MMQSLQDMFFSAQQKDANEKISEQPNVSASAVKNAQKKIKEVSFSNESHIYNSSFLNEKTIIFEKPHSCFSYFVAYHKNSGRRPKVLGTAREKGARQV